MEENKRKKGGLSGFIMLALVIGIMVGANHWTNIKNEEKLEQTIENDDSYKVITARDKSYNGVYSLTKLDKKGNNTWDGLMMYVKDDKIVDCALIDYMTLEEAKQRYPAGDAKNACEFYDSQNLTFFKDFDARWQYRDDGKNSSVFIGASRIERPHIITGVRNTAVYYQKNVDLKADYDFLKDMELIPGYDEKSKEIWLSKLLKNKQSVYHKGYKLRKYTNQSDINKNCKIDMDSTMYTLNDEYNAGLSEE